MKTSLRRTSSGNCPPCNPPLPSLRRLELVSPEVRTEVHLLAIVTACPGLEELRLEHMSFLTLGVLPPIGKACPLLRTLHLLKCPLTMFVATTLAVRDMAKGWPTAASSSSPSTDRSLFPHLTDLQITRLEYSQYDADVLFSLVALLTPSPLTTLRLPDLDLDADDYDVFAPLRHLVHFDVMVDSRDLPLYQVEERTSRRRCKEWMSRELFTSEWGVDDSRFWTGRRKFVREPQWRVKGGGQVRWMNGREAFFASHGGERWARHRDDESTDEDDDDDVPPGRRR